MFMEKLFIYKPDLNPKMFYYNLHFKILIEKSVIKLNKNYQKLILVMYKWFPVRGFMVKNSNTRKQI